MGKGQGKVLTNTGLVIWPGKKLIQPADYSIGFHLWDFTTMHQLRKHGVPFLIDRCVCHVKCTTKMVTKERKDDGDYLNLEVLTTYTLTLACLHTHDQILLLLP